MRKKVKEARTQNKCASNAALFIKIVHFNSEIRNMLNFKYLHIKYQQVTSITSTNITNSRQTHNHSDYANTRCVKITKYIR